MNKIAKTVIKTDSGRLKTALTNKFFIDKELQYVAHNYKALPVTITRGKGLFLFDVEGKRYYDFHSGYSSTNQGHSHPRILKEFIAQSKKLT